MKTKTIDMIGWFASIMAIAMYVSYIDQIQRNLGGQPGSIIQPGIILGSITLITAII